MAKDWVTRPAGRLTVLHGMRSGQDDALFGELCSTLAGRDDADVCCYVSGGSPCAVPAHEWAAGRIGSDAIGRAIPGRAGWGARRAAAEACRGAATVRADAPGPPRAARGTDSRGYSPRDAVAR